MYTLVGFSQVARRPVDVLGRDTSWAIRATTKSDQLRIYRPMKILPNRSIASSLAFIRLAAPP